MILFVRLGSIEQYATFNSTSSDHVGRWDIDPTGGVVRRARDRDSIRPQDHRPGMAHPVCIRKSSAPRRSGRALGIRHQASECVDNRHMKTQKTCPKCGSPHIGTPSKQESAKFGVFHMSAPLKCATCMHLWMPAPPRWALWTGVMGSPLLIFVGGYSLVILLIWPFIYRDMDRLPIVAFGLYFALFAAILGMGLRGFIGCIRALRQPSVSPALPPPVPVPPVISKDQT